MSSMMSEMLPALFVWCKLCCVPWSDQLKLAPYVQELCIYWFYNFWGIIITNPLTARVVGAPQMILQPVFSIFPCSPLPSGTCWTPGLSIPWCCLLASSFVCLFFFSLSLCLARWFWPDLMNRRLVHTSSVCVSLLWSGGLRVVWLPAGSWLRLSRW